MPMQIAKTILACLVCLPILFVAIRCFKRLVDTLVDEKEKK